MFICMQKPCHPLFNIGLEAVCSAHEYFDPVISKSRRAETVDIPSNRTAELSEQLRWCTEQDFTASYILQLYPRVLTVMRM